MTNNNTIIYTNNFGYINGFEHITLDKIPKKSIDDAINDYRLLNEIYKFDSLRETRVNKL